jgi:CubicO group peptidase (beta-lactamase class C family)
MHGSQADKFSEGSLGRLESALQQVIDSQRIAGAVTLIWRKGEMAHAAAAGYRDLKAQVPMTRDTLFRIASMTKPVVSLAALLLMQEDKLRLEDPVTRWLPELADMQVLNDPAGPLDDTTPAWRQITVEDLLTHRSGLAAGYTASGPIAEAYTARLRSWLTDPMSPDEWLKVIGALPLLYSPGERFHYGCSLDALGFLIARIEGKGLGTVLRTRIFEPLGMHDTFFWTPPEKRHRLARLYRTPEQAGPLKEVSFTELPAAPAFESGSGGLISTADDYLKFVQLLLGCGTVDGVHVAAGHTIALMSANRLTPSQRALPFAGAVNYWATRGFGLGLSMILERPMTGYRGPNPGAYGWPGAFGTWWLADPSEDMALVYMTQDYVTLDSAALGQILSGERPPGRAAFEQLAYAAIPECALRPSSKG